MPGSNTESLEMDENQRHWHFRMRRIWRSRVHRTCLGQPSLVQSHREAPVAPIFVQLCALWGPMRPDFRGDTLVRTSRPVRLPLCSTSPCRCRVGFRHTRKRCLCGACRSAAPSPRDASSRCRCCAVADAAPVLLRNSLAPKRLSWAPRPVPGGASLSRAGARRRAGALRCGHAPGGRRLVRPPRVRVLRAALCARSRVARRARCARHFPLAAARAWRAPPRSQPGSSGASAPGLGRTERAPSASWPRSPLRVPPRAARPRPAVATLGHRRLAGPLCTLASRSFRRPSVNLRNVKVSCSGIRCMFGPKLERFAAPTQPFGLSPISVCVIAGAHPLLVPLHGRRRSHGWHGWRRSHGCRRPHGWRRSPGWRRCHGSPAARPHPALRAAGPPN